MADHYANHSIQIQDTADSAAVVLGSLTSVAAPIDPEVLKEETGGRAYVDQISVVSMKPRMTFNSFDVPKVVDAFGLTGRTLTEATSPTAKPGLALYQAAYANGTLKAGSVHRRLRFPLSHARVNRISVSHRGDAQAECEAVAIWDGTNNPVLVEASQALPTLPGSSGRWTIGSVTFDEISIDCLTQLDIDFGFSVDPFGCDSDVYDTHFHVNQIAPMITLTSLDPANFAAAKVTLAGLIGAHTDVTIVLRKRTANQASFVANATAEHITITAAGTLLVTEAHNATGNQKAQASFRIETAFDGTNAPLVFDTSDTIA